MPQRTPQNDTVSSCSTAQPYISIRKTHEHRVRWIANTHYLRYWKGLQPFRMGSWGCRCLPESRLCSRWCTTCRIARGRLCSRWCTACRTARGRPLSTQSQRIVRTKSRLLCRPPPDTRRFSRSSPAAWLRCRSITGPTRAARAPPVSSYKLVRVRSRRSRLIPTIRSRGSWMSRPNCTVFPPCARCSWSVVGRPGRL